MATPSVSQQTDTLNTIFLGLRNKSPETRLQSALELRRYVATKVVEMSSDAATKLWEDSINQRLFDLVHSSHSHDNLGGILAIDHLLDVYGEETIEFKHNLFRFYNYVKSQRIGGAAFGEHFMDFEVPAAIGLLQGDKQEPGWYAGVLILKELARNSPVYFHSHIDLVFDKIHMPIRDPRVIVREGAAELLAACLEIIAQRERQGRTTRLSKTLADAQAGLKMSQPEIIHGALLTYRELLLHGGMFMRENFMDTAESILRFRTSRDPFVRKMVITLIPTLAVYDTQTFSEHFLHKAMDHFLTLLGKSSDREFAFVAIGHVAKAVGSDMKPFLDSIMQQVKFGLQNRGKKAPPEEPMFQCVGMLAAAIASWTRCRLILSDKSYKHLGAPALMRGNVSTKSTGTTKSPELITLALTILGEFDFSGHVLNEFVRNCALPYLEEDFPEVRKAAALTCCSVFRRDPICFQGSNNSIEVISDVIDKLLTVGIADPGLSTSVLWFREHLAQAENVRSLFIALNDEIFENRETAVGLIGRLALHNPAYVMPSLRKSLIQLLTELEYSTVTRNREDCTRLLTLLVSATQRLIKPYALPMLRVLLQKAGDPNSTVAANVLMCLGELTCVGGEDVTPHVPELMDIILSKLADSSIVKRDAALHALGQVCSSTGFVIQPLVEYPQLLQIFGRILKSEPNPSVRREVIKVLGIIGALDPYRRKTRPDEESNEAQTPTAAAINLTHTTSSASDDYYQTVVINALLSILKDQSLSGQHHTVIEAIMSIFKTQGLKCVTFLPQIIPAFAAVTRSSAARLQEFHLQQLAILIGIIKQHVRKYMPDIFGLVTDLWENQSLQLPLVSLIESLGKALDAEFRPFLPTILPLILKVFDGELNDKRSATQIKVFDAFLTFGSNIEEYLHLVIPIIVKTYERLDASTSLRKRAIVTIDGLSSRVNFSDHASRIIHPLVRVLTSSNNELRMAVLDTLCSLLVQLGSDFAIFVPTINKARYLLWIHRTTAPQNTTPELFNGERLPQELGTLEYIMNESNKTPEFSAPAEAAKMAVNQQHLKQAWDTSLVSTREDWLEWMHRLSVEFMKESPSHALRACMSLVDVHSPLAKELFNAAFISCWRELYEQYQEDLVRAVDRAITSPTAPSELIHRLLNLCEFMEHEDQRLPIENSILGEYALKYHAYAKALHYKELEFFTETSPSIIEALIGINTKLQQSDAAWGTLLVAREQYDITKHDQWYERLGRWQEALRTYERREQEDPGNPDISIGRMKCLHGLGEWDQLAVRVEEYWASATHEERREIAPMAAAAAWSLNDWDSMDDYIATMKADSTDRAFYRAILSVHQNQFSKALTHITKARDLLDPELTGLIGESYGRSYNVMVRAQMLSELEEIIAYKQFADQPERQQTIRKTWVKRLQGCQPDVEVWQRILQVRTLVLSPDDDPAMWIKFANLCRKSERMLLAEKTINSLLSQEPHQKAPPNVVYAQLKYMWASGSKEESLTFLRTFATSLSRDLETETTQRGQRSSVSKQKLDELARLLARCYFKQGEWQMELSDNWATRNVKDILHSYLLATHFDPNWYKAWHTWAFANFEVVNHLLNQAEVNAADIMGTTLVPHIIPAVQGFFRSIALRSEDALQDTLRLLTLWFKFGAHDEVSHAIASGFSTVEVDTWLEVIPQIIARIQTPNPNIRRNITSLLTDVGKHHPQALVYPLTVASKSPSALRKDAALAIMDRMKQHSPAIVEQALVVSHELIRVAILWHEQWHEKLEEASRQYYTEHNPEGMIAALEPLLRRAREGTSNCARNIFHPSVRSLSFKRQRERRVDIRNMVFKKVEKQLPQLATLDLQYVSPELLKARDLELAVPAEGPSSRFMNFAPKLTIIISKQRPRRLYLRGSDGKEYQYLLKGHEDLRQDERVMQLFSLVNTLLSEDTDSFKRRLHIQRYPVIPLGPDAGLIGWVVNDSDTLHVLVRDYRESRKVLLNIEQAHLFYVVKIVRLTVIEVFEYALENTTGQDLYRVLWLKSINSEHWLERRATFTRSLAVNSMVGHILGLGDRHPSNIMLERKTGKVVHVDFGDCFEVAMHREKFPEKIPFRLTRMLTHAMEVSGIEGSYRNTCEITMRVLRDNKDSLMAVLEAFVYDPLINWRLMPTKGDSRRSPGPAGESARTSDLSRINVYAQEPVRKLKADENTILNDIQHPANTRTLIEEAQERNDRALAVLIRVQHKLTGRDFNPDVVLSVQAQVDKLILQATSLENLCQCFSGWCAFW
ncbi:atypical/PIKK/FRAP protein kinase [Lactarius deliciosus]|nr:atypical/PIKK/FRAP protein kinase [Lactarius deliciosus]